MVMKRLSEYLFFWTLGGTLYYSFEMIFRGFSHWSMFMLGGFCLVFCIQQGIWTGWDSPLWLQVLWCSVFVTTGEFITGILVNKVMHWHVWDYRIMRSGNLSRKLSDAFFIRRKNSSFSCIVRRCCWLLKSAVRTKYVD